MFAHVSTMSSTVPGRDREVDEPIARLASRTAVLDPEVDGSVVVEPAGLDFGINAERSGDRQGVPCAVGPPASQPSSTRCPVGRAANGSAMLISPSGPNTTK